MNRRQLLRSVAGLLALGSLPVAAAKVRWSGGARPVHQVSGPPTFYWSVEHDKLLEAYRAQLCEIERLKAELAQQADEKQQLGDAIRKSFDETDKLCKTVSQSLRERVAESDKFVEACRRHKESTA